MQARGEGHGGGVDGHVGDGGAAPGWHAHSCGQPHVKAVNQRISWRRWAGSIASLLRQQLSSGEVCSNLRQEVRQRQVFVTMRHLDLLHRMQLPHTRLAVQLCTGGRRIC